MSKLRNPSSIEDALDQAIGFVKVDVVAKWIRKSASMVRKMADPDNDAHHLRLCDAMCIDRELAAGGFPQVFALMLAESAKLNSEDLGEVVVEAPLSSATRMVCTAADVLEGVEAAEADGVIDDGEVRRLFLQLERLQSQMAPLRRALHQRSTTTKRGRK